MKLAESIQDEVFDQFKVIKSTFKEFKESCEHLEELTKDSEGIKVDISYFTDFITNEVGDRLDSLKNAILDEYIPIDYGDEESDYQKASQKYRDSIEARETALD